MTGTSAKYLLNMNTDMRKTVTFKTFLNKKTKLY